LNGEGLVMAPVVVPDAEGTAEYVVEAEPVTAMPEVMVETQVEEGAVIVVLVM